MRIGIAGGGVVGQATARSYLEHVCEVRVYDVLKERRTHDLEDVFCCDLIFVCLPTPQRENSRECDVSVLDAFFGQTGLGLPSEKRRRQSASYVLRSTVPIGTTRRLRKQYGLPNLVHSPEFLTARCAVEDAQMPARNIIGVPEPDLNGGVFSGRNQAAQLLNVLYHQRFPGVPVHLLGSNESEAVKLFQNSFFAVKVAFWNECRALADRLGLDWERLLPAILADGRIGSSHTKVPGPDGRRGFGGSCLPKDLANLVHQLGDEAAVTLAALTRNRKDREAPLLHQMAIREALARDMA